MASFFPSNLEGLIREADSRFLPDAIGDLERLKAIAQQRLLAPPPAPAAQPVDGRPLTTAELAERAGCSAWYIKELVHRRKLTPIVAGGGRHGHFKFEPVDVENVKRIMRNRRPR